MPVPRIAQSEPLPGYRLLEPLGKGGFGEVWKCEVPGGLTKAIKFVHGCTGLENHNNAQQELLALQRIKSLRHPFLLSLERVEIVEGDLLIVMELADRSLHDVLQQHLQAGRSGIPRGEILAYLHEAAEVLDLLNQQHHLLHLDIKPRNLFLIGRHIKVGDFGLLASLVESRSRNLTGITPLYAAPELFEGRPTPFSDQFSLAISYVELLTGKLPFVGKSLMHLTMLITSKEPDLEAVPEYDRPIVSRALNKVPQQRFGSCTEFVQALESATPPGQTGPYRPRTTSFEISLGDHPSQTQVMPTVKPEGRKQPPTAIPIVESNEEILPGYTLLECHSRGQTGELWKARNPRGEMCQVRFFNLPGRESPAAGALDRLLHLQHDTLAMVEAFSLPGDRVALVSESGKPLTARFKERRAAGHAGIARQELLSYLQAIARVLDELSAREQLQHLVLNPTHLVSIHDQPVLLDFGLAELLWLPEGISLAQLNPRYAALELFHGLVSDACDQYSLALIYQELLVGLHPYRNLNARQMATPKLRGQPDLSLLPSTDRPVVMQALNPEPDRRFRSCSDFIAALWQATEPTCEREEAVVAPVRSRPTCVLRPSTVSPWRQVVEELVERASQGHSIQTIDTLCYRYSPGHCLEHRCLARLAPGMARLKLASFRDQWHASIVTLTERHAVLDIPGPSSFWQRCLGQKAGLRLEVVISQQRDPSTQLTPVRITLLPNDPGHSRSHSLLQEQGPAILQSLQICLDSTCQGVSQARYPFSQSVQLQSQNGLSLAGQVRDIGLDGLTLYAATAAPSGTVKLTLEGLHVLLPRIEIPAWVRDCWPEQGRYEIDLMFC